jgi:hypothetical protein
MNKPQNQISLCPNFCDSFYYDHNGFNFVVYEGLELINIKKNCRLKS